MSNEELVPKQEPQEAQEFSSVETPIEKSLPVPTSIRVANNPTGPEAGSNLSNEPSTEAEIPPAAEPATEPDLSKQALTGQTPEVQPILVEPQGQKPTDLESDEIQTLEPDRSLEKEKNQIEQTSTVDPSSTEIVQPQNQSSVPDSHTKMDTPDKIETVVTSADASVVMSETTPLAQPQVVGQSEPALAVTEPVTEPVTESVLESAPVNPSTVPENDVSQDNFNETSHITNDDDQDISSQQKIQTFGSSAPGKPVVQPPNGPDAPILLKEQFKFMANLFRNMKKKKDAVPFLAPVDPIALNIPTYFDIVKKPMDISTIDRKLSRKEYTTVQQVVDDFYLMVNNCHLFNGAQSVVGAMGTSCQVYFEREFAKFPKDLQSVTEKKKKMSEMGRQSIDNRPKREVLAPSRETSVSAQRKRTKNSPELKFCGYVLSHVMKKPGQPYNYPFLVPVDPIALGIPQYFDIVKHPMDLSTMKKKLDNGDYDNASEFEADMRLMFNNCYTFNGPVAEVSHSARQLEAIFEQKWREMHSYLQQHGEQPRKKSLSSRVHDSPSGGYGAGNGFSDDMMDFSEDDDEDLQHINMIKSQLSLLTSQLKMLQEKRAKKLARKRQSLPMSPPLPSQSLSGPAAPVRNKPGPKPGKRTLKDKTEKKKRPRKDDDETEPDEITYEQKRELSEKINALSQDKLMHVFEIIKENANLNNATGEDEIELDIDSLSKSVLWKLYLFVRKHSQPAKKAKAGKGYDSSSGEDTDDSGSLSD